MRNKGFTLIELLAVIVILAIIALIATPIILNIIDETKNEATTRSVENYIDAVELALANNILEDELMQDSGKFKVLKDGKQIQLLSGENLIEKPIDIKFDGKGLDTGSILVIGDGEVKKILDGTIDKQPVRIILGRVRLFKREPESTLIRGTSFNAKIKTLVSGAEKNSGSSDSIVTSIEFLSYGMLPEGYTLEQLQEYDSVVDVSAKGDRTILAIYDGKGKVFIYSEDLIVFNSNLDSMFHNFFGVESIVFGEIDTRQVTTLDSMFVNCSNLTKLDLSSFDTSNVTEFSFLFAYCKNLKSIDISSFDTSSATTMNSMFRGLSSLESLDVRHFDTSNVTNMGLMFYGCGKLTNLDISNFETSGVTNMASMFHACGGLTSLDLSSFDTSDVISMSNMFNTCTGLTNLNISNFKTPLVTDMSNMFFGTTNLQNLDISNFTFNESVNTTNMFSTAKSDMNITINKNVTENFIKGLHPTATITIAQ